MDQVSTLERVFSYKAKANHEILAAMRLFEGASPAREIALRVLSHTYAVDRIFAANMTGAEHGYSSPNPGNAPALEELAVGITSSDQWYLDYVSSLDEARLAEPIDFTFTDGLPGRMSRAEMLMHVTVHGEYHRGQISLIMMQNSIEPPPDGFTSFLHKTEASSRRRPSGSGDTVKGSMTEAAAKGATEISLDELTARMKNAVGADSGLGKTVKFDLKGAGCIYLDGGSVTNDDHPADLTLTVTIEDLEAISAGKLAPMTAMMSGRLSLSDVGIAASIQGKLQSLFSRMRPAS